MKRSTVAALFAALTLTACGGAAEDDGNNSGDSNPDNVVDEPSVPEVTPTS